MKKRFFVVFALCALTCLSWGQSTIKERLEAKYGWAVEQTTDGKKWYSVIKDGKEGACDANGKELIPPEYDDVSVDYEDNYIKTIKDKKTSIYDLNGKLILATPYEDVRWYQMKKDPYCEVKLDGKWGLMDKKGELIVPCEYEGFSTYEVEKTGYCEVKQNKKCGVYDIKNKRLMIPCLYDDVSHYQFGEDDYAGVKLNGKNGCINRQGDLVVPCMYDDVSTYQIAEKGICDVTLGRGVNKRIGIYDVKNGRELVPCKYENIKGRNRYKYGDYYIVVRDGQYGIVDKSGSEVVPCIYSYIADTYGDGKYFCATKGGELPADAAPARMTPPIAPINALWGVIDIHGKELVPFNKELIRIYGNIALIGKGVDRKYKVERTVFDRYDNNKRCIYYTIESNEEKTLYGFYNLKSGKSTECLYKKYNVRDDYIPCMNKSGKWGYLEAETMTEAIPFEYEEASAFKDGVAQVKKDGKATFLTDPKNGTSLILANGGNSIKVDGNIPVTKEKQEESFAFIIANENYTHLKGADYAINDGKVFKEYCLKTFGMPESNVRYFEDATYGNIVNAVKKIKDIADVYEGDAKIIVYFSGLGTTEATSKERYILPTDASLEALNMTGYSVQTLMDELNSLNTKQMIVILDAPFSGLDKEGKMLGENRGVAIVPKPTAPKGNTVIITACSGNESAYSLKDYGHSLFTYGLLEKIQDSKGQSSLKEAVDYATTWVKKESLKRLNKTQTPQLQAEDAIKNNLNNIKF